MNLVTPARACIFLKGFIERIERLSLNQYSNPRFYTCDINKLEIEINKYVFICSIAVHNRNKDYATKLIEISSNKLTIARDLLYKFKQH